jgi:hypothetical protein
MYVRIHGVRGLIGVFIVHFACECVVSGLNSSPGSMMYESLLPEYAFMLAPVVWQGQPAGKLYR